MFSVPHSGSEITCPDPGPVTFSTRIGTNFSYGAEVTFQCDPGFYTQEMNKTEMIITCGYDSMWSALSDCKGRTRQDTSFILSTVLVQ